MSGGGLTGTQDLILLKFNSSGTQLGSSKQLGAVAATTNAYRLAIDSSNNIVVSGNINGDLDGNTLTGNSDFFISKYDSSLTKQWTRQLGVIGKDSHGISPALDSSSNIFVCGISDGNFDGNNLTGTQDSFIIHFNSAGVKQ